jgi:uroporphyrinogen decarboxylase
MELDTPCFERFRMAILRQQPDRIPIAEWGVDRSIKQILLGKESLVPEDEVEFAKLAGYDYVLLSPSYHIPESRMTSRSLENDSVPEDAIPWAVEGKGGLIEDEKDLESFPWPEPDELDFTVFDSAIKRLPYGMGIIARGHNILALAWRLMGFEAFSFALFENPSLIKRIIRQLGSLQVEIAKKTLDYSEVGAFWHADDIAFGTSLLFSPDVIRHLLFPYMEEIAALCHQRERLFIYHSDGNIEPVINDLIRIGVDAIHPIEPNAMDIQAVKERYGQKIGLIGNIDVDVLARGTVEEVELLVRERIRRIGIGGGYCVASGNSVPSYVKVENYQAMLSTARKYGVYPLA